MRFNKQELVAIASQTSPSFDREGILVLKEKLDGFFRRSEGCSARWFRLRGNLLFYLRGTEPLSEPMGVIVLGNHHIKLQAQDENGHWPFQIVWDSGVCYKMATFLESERKLWLKAIESASYDNLRTRITELKQKINGIQPIVDISTWRLERGVIVDINEIPLCELALSCDNLLCDAHGRPPSPMIVLYLKYPNNPLSVRYSSTETVDKCSNPSFARTILFRACDGLAGDTVVRIIVYDVKDPVSETMVPMGYAALLLSTIQEAQRLRIALTTQDCKTVGFVTVNGWSLEPSYIGTSPSHTTDRNSVDIPQKVLCHRRSQSLPPRLGMKLKFPSIGNLLKQNFVNSHQVTYRFHSGLGGDITVHEIMAEARLCFHMPIQLLDIYIEREKELLQEMLSLGEMSGQWKTKQLELVDTHLSVLRHYWHSKKSLQIMGQDKFFKQSCKKDDPSLEFAPVNLHLQRMWVHNDTLNKTGFHDIVTVGAFAAHSHKAERSGGLIRLVQQVKDISNSTATFNSVTASKLQSEGDNLIAVKRLREEIAEACDQIVTYVRDHKMSDVAPLIETIVSKTRSLLTLWDPGAVEEALSFITWNKSKGITDGVTQSVSVIKRLNDQLNSFEGTIPDFDRFEGSSSSSSKDTSPTDGPSLYSSVPNISRNNVKDKNDKEDSGLHFHNDYFNSEKAYDNQERCSSMRLAKGKLNDAQSFSFDRTASRKFKYSMDLKSYFKGSTSLEHVTFKNSSGNIDKEISNNEHPDIQEKRRESFSLTSMNRNHCNVNKKDSRGEPYSVMTADIEQNLTGLVDAINEITANPDESVKEAAVSLLARLVTSLTCSMDVLADKLWRAHAAARLRSEPVQCARAHAALQLRRDTCTAQALTAVSTGLLCWLCSMPNETVVRLLSTGLGPLCSFEGLLTLYQAEKGMWGDMVVAIEDLQTVVFELTPVNMCANSMPQVSGSRGALVVHIPVPDALYAKFTLKQHLRFTITAVFFNIGINERATVAEALGEATPQRQSNCDNLDRLTKYYQKYSKIFPRQSAGGPRASSRTKPLEEVMESLRVAALKKTPKNVEVLQLAALAARLMNGIRVTSCKSAKDRTGMSATLEQCQILASEYHLADHEMGKVLHILRSEGCRRENTYKNIGVRKYAFTKKQLLALPPDYRPPAGSYGSTQT